jgi:hypothetical protein
MATSAAAAVQIGVDSYSRACTATADADTTLVIPHGLAFNSAADAQANLDYRLKEMTLSGALAGWFVSAIDATNITLTKTTAVGSGAAPASLSLEYFRRATIIGH